MLIFGTIARKCALALVILFIKKKVSISVTIRTGNLFFKFCAPNAVQKGLGKSKWEKNVSYIVIVNDSEKPKF